MNLFNDPIAIVGMGCRYPDGANLPHLLWTILKEKKDCITEIPEERWDYRDYHNSDNSISKWGGFLQGIKPDEFDAAFFGIASGEATSLDPQQRWLLEVSWEALEYGGIDPRELRARKVGIYIGISTHDYLNGTIASQDLQRISHYSGTGSSFSTAAGRLAYFYGTYGPALSLDTACSSSLVAFHQACQSLRMGECDMAIVGGVNALLTPHLHVYLSKLGVMSRKGRCQSFDQSADGYVRSEGCGVMVLQRLADARREGRTILAHCIGSAVNQDGHGASLTAPNVSAQEQCIRQALRQAKIDAREVGYIEAHGTGNPLGDATELQALGSVFASGRETPLWLGSVKSNIGHLEAGAGVAGLIKTVLIFRYGMIPPNLHFKQPCDAFTSLDQVFRIPKNTVAWERNKIPRRAGISSFGFSGTNAHVILEEPHDEVENRKPSKNFEDRPVHILTFSGKSKNALHESVSQGLTFLEKHNCSLADVGYTLNAGRAHFAHRFAVWGNSVNDVISQLKNRLWEQTEVDLAKELVFTFTPLTKRDKEGVKEFLRTSPVFYTEFKKWDDVTQSKGLKSLFLYIQNDGDAGGLEEEFVLQTSLLCILFLLWNSWGVVSKKLIAQPSTLLAALYCSEIITMEETVELSCFLSQENKPLSDEKLASIGQRSSQLTLFFDTQKECNFNRAWLTTLKDRFTLDLQHSPHFHKEVHFDLRLGMWSKDEVLSWNLISKTLCALSMQGWDINWKAFDSPYERNVLCEMPTYPFQRKKYYINPMEPLLQKIVKPVNPKRNLETQDIQERLCSCIKGKRGEYLKTCIHDTALHILGDVTSLEYERPLVEQGFDSLTAVELRNRLAKDLELSLPVTLLFNYPTIQALADYLMEIIPWDDWTNEGKTKPSEEQEESNMESIPDELHKTLTDEEMKHLDGLDDEELEQWIKDDLESI